MPNLKNKSIFLFILCDKISGSFIKHQQHFNFFVYFFNQTFEQITFLGCLPIINSTLIFFVMLWIKTAGKLTFCAVLPYIRSIAFFFVYITGQNFGQVTVLPSINNISIGLFTLRTKILGKLHFWGRFAETSLYLHFLLLTLGKLIFLYSFTKHQQHFKFFSCDTSEYSANCNFGQFCQTPTSFQFVSNVL